MTDNTNRRRAAQAQIEREQVIVTGSDDFDVPEVARAVRASAGMTEASKGRLYAIARRHTLGNADLPPEERQAAYDRAVAAINEVVQ